MTASGEGPAIGSCLMRRLVSGYRRLPAVDQPIEGRSRVFPSVRLQPLRSLAGWSANDLCAVPVTHRPCPSGTGLYQEQTFQEQTFGQSALIVGSMLEEQSSAVG